MDERVERRRCWRLVRARRCWNVVLAGWAVGRERMGGRAVVRIV